MYTVLITCVGGDLAPQMIMQLKNSKIHNVEVVGVDVNNDAIGKIFCDEFSQVPYGNSLEYCQSIKALVDLYNVDLVIPTSDEEAVTLSHSKDLFDNCLIACVDSDMIDVLTDKEKTFEFLKEYGVHTPETRIVEKYSDLKKSVELMYKDFGEFVVKPTCARGGRGVYVVSSKYEEIKYFDDRREVHSDMDSFVNSLMHKLENDMPLLVMERLIEPVIDIDLLGWNGEKIKVVPRRRVNSAVPNDGHILLDNQLLTELGEKLIKIFKLSWLYACDLMFDSKGQPCILEINPRQSGSMSVSVAAGIPLLDDLISLAKNERSLISDTKCAVGVKVVPYKSLYSFPL